MMKICKMFHQRSVQLNDINGGTRRNIVIQGMKKEDKEDYTEQKILGFIVQIGVGKWKRTSTS